MKAAVYRIPGKTHEDQLTAMAAGLDRHGVHVQFFSDLPAQDADFTVTWSWRVGMRVRQYFSRPILCMERGYLGNRFEWTSLGWDGLNGRARFTVIDNKSRFEKHFGDLLKPWKSTTGYALIVGQVAGDTALVGTDIRKWYKETSVSLFKQGWDVAFRQHPVEVERGVALPSVPFARMLSGSLAEALLGAGLVVSFNSNSGTDAVMAGVPVYAADEGSMVYELASRDFNPVKPDRSSRLQEMAWFQYSIDEIKSGAAWDVVKESMIA